MLPGLSAFSASSPDPDTLLLLQPTRGPVDLSMYRHTVGNLGGAPTLVSGDGGVNDQCWRLNTGGFQITPEADFDFGVNPFTIEFWFKLANYTDEQVLLCKASSGTGSSPIQLPVHANKMYARVSSSSTAFNVLNDAFLTPPPTGVWMHFAVTRDAAKVIRFFVNGVYRSGTTSGASLYNTGNGLCFGRPAGGSYVFTGWIDQIRVRRVCDYSANFTPSHVPYRG